jgi:ATP-dependent Clp protease protease subunit
MKRTASNKASVGEMPTKRTIQMFGVIDDTCANEVIAQLLFHHMQNKTDPIVLEIDSAGGSLTSTFAILETMRYVLCPIWTVCYGQAYGCAALLLASGAHGHRMAVPDAQLGFCKSVIKAEAEDQPPGQIFFDQLNDRLLQELASACKQPKQRIAEDLDSEQSFSCNEAIRYGLLDGAVAGRFPRIDRALPNSRKQSPGLTIPLEDIVATIVIILVFAGVVTVILSILK